MSRQQTKRPSRRNTLEVQIELVNGRHFDNNLERSIIGACLNESAAFAVTKGAIEPDFFYSDTNKLLYAAMTRMYADGEQIDLLTVLHRLRRDDVHELDGAPAAYILTGLAYDPVSSAHLFSWCVILRELYIERLLIQVSSGATGGEGDSIAKATATQELLKKALSLKVTDDWRDMSQVMIALEQHRETVQGKDMLGVSSGLPTLDRLTFGLQPGQLIVVGARPSVGKSAFAGGIAVEAARSGAKVGFVSLEMPEEQIGARMASLYSDVEFWRIYRNKHRDGDEERRLLSSMSNLAGLPIYMTDKTSVSGSAIRAKAEKLKRRKGLDLLIIDYLQLIEAEGKSTDIREREVAKLSRSLKVMAMDLKVPVIVLCQLNRDSEKAGAAGNKKPRMSQIRESGAIEQDADVVLLIHREWKSGVLNDEQGNSTERKANVIVEKNRNGETQDIPVDFNPETMRFYESDADQFYKAQTTAINTFHQRAPVDFSEPRRDEGEYLPF